MPSLVRFTRNLALLGLIVYGAMFALVTFVAPQQHEIVTTVRAEVRPEENREAKPSLLRTMKKTQAHHKRLFTSLNWLQDDHT